MNFLSVQNSEIALSVNIFILLKIWAPFYIHRLNLISARINVYTDYKVWDEITYPFSILNGTSIEVWE